MSFKSRVLKWLNISTDPVINAYDGYGDYQKGFVNGHVLAVSPLPRKSYRQNLFLNLFGMIRLFIVKPIRGARIILEFEGESHETSCDSEGFFQFEFNFITRPKAGWHKVNLSYISPLPAAVKMAESHCNMFIPHSYQYSFISDIDDTFLISHSTKLWKRLLVLFSKNAISRKPFKGVVEHYTFLALASSDATLQNPFFYVSSSEWNLYHYIRKFMEHHKLPKGVLMLSKLKRIHELFGTGQGKHAGKYIRISHILRLYPDKKYVLLGDNSQMDPEIYLKVCEEHKGLVHAVYLRNVESTNHIKTQEIAEKIKAFGVEVCYFSDSSEALMHSRNIGLIQGLGAV